MRLSSSSLLSIGTLALAEPTAFSRGQQQQQPSLRRSSTATTTKTTNRNEHNHRLESLELEPGVFSIAVSLPTDDSNINSNNEDRGRFLQTELVLKLQDLRSCVIMLEDVFYNPEDPKDSDAKWVCSFENFIDEEGGVPHPYAFNFAGDTQQTHALFEETGVVSGEYDLKWDSDDAVSIDEDEFTISLNTSALGKKHGAWVEANDSAVLEDGEENSSSNRRRRKLVRTTGSKKTIVLRIVGDGVGPRASLGDLKEKIFGSGTSFKTQMEKCSNGRMTIEAFEGMATGQFNGFIQGGVVELRLATNPRGESEKKMENDANLAAYYVFGDLRDQFDLVLFAMPPGIVPEFSAYAYVGSPFSYYTDDNIENTMVTMHEVGHNLGLQHSGEGSEEYGDASGFMGYSATHNPSMCYNAANNYQLGWFSKYTIRPVDVGGTFFVTGVAGYDAFDNTEVASLRLEQKNKDSDYYIGYNWASGLNIGTQEDANRVIVLEKDGGVHDFKLTWKRAALSIGEYYVIQNYDNTGKSVTITFASTDQNDAVVKITAETSTVPVVSPQPSSPPTASPTASPTFPPSPPPTSSPTTPGTVCDDRVHMTINIRTDTRGYETRWFLKKQRVRGVIDRVTPNTYSSNKKYTSSYCLDFDSCYVFKVFDGGSDGMSKNKNNRKKNRGHYEGYVGDELKFRNEGDWGKKKTHRFCTPPDETRAGFHLDDEEAPAASVDESGVDVETNGIEADSENIIDTEVVLIDEPVLENEINSDTLGGNTDLEEDEHEIVTNEADSSVVELEEGPLTVVENEADSGFIELEEESLPTVENEADSGFVELEEEPLTIVENEADSGLVELEEEPLTTVENKTDSDINVETGPTLVDGDENVR